MTKYIDRELALSLPFANGRYDEENANIDFICGCETYKEYLESLPYFEVEEWIPVSERLPKKEQYVLVSTDMNYVATATFKGDYWESNFDLDWEEVVAWMESPKPFEVKENEKIVKEKEV